MSNFPQNLNTIKIPKTYKCTLTIMVGLPRSGKDTWIEKNKGDTIVVSNDWIRENILGTHYCPASNAIVWTLTDAVLRVVLSQGKDVILNGVNHTKTVRAFYIKLAKEYDAKIKIVYMDVLPAVCIRRNFENKLPDAVILKMWEELDFPNYKEYDELEVIHE